MPLIASALLAIILAIPGATAPVPEPTLTKEQTVEWDKLWAYATGNGNGASEVRLICRLLAEPRLAPEYLKSKLRPLKLSEAEAKGLIGQLGSEKEEEWKEAYRELRCRDVRLAMTLPETWAETKSAVQRRRLAGATSYWGGRYDTPAQWAEEFGRIYQRGDFTLLPPQPPEMEWKLCHIDENQRSAGRVSVDLAGWQKENPHAFDCVRMRLMLRTLEQIGSREARAVIELVATGNPDALPTKDAVAASKRMKAVSQPANPESRMSAGLRMLHFWQQPAGAAIDPAALAVILTHPDQTVPFLKSKLRPLKMTLKEGEALLARLFSDDPKECRGAFREFQHTDIRAAMTTQEAWARAMNPDHRGRLVRAMEGWYEDLSGDFPVDDQDHKFLDFELRKQPDNFKVPGWCAVAVQRPGVTEKHRLVGSATHLGNTLADAYRNWRWDREESAIYILEAIGTDEALAIIKDMATGHPDAHPTIVAKAVLKQRER